MSRTMAGLAARPLAEITADALRVNCGHCWSEPGKPCAADAPDLMHPARFARCRRKGLISDEDMCAVLDAAGDVSEPSTVIRTEAAVTA